MYSETRVYQLESCGARFLGPRPCNAPLPFAPTRTGPKSSKFYGPDPGPTRLYFPRTGPTRLYFSRTGPKQYSINPKLANFRLQLACEYALQKRLQLSYNIIQRANQG